MRKNIVILSGQPMQRFRFPNPFVIDTATLKIYHNRCILNYEHTDKIIGFAENFKTENDKLIAEAEIKDEETKKWIEVGLPFELSGEFDFAESKVIKGEKLNKITHVSLRSVALCRNATDAHTHLFSNTNPIVKMEELLKKLTELIGEELAKEIVSKVTEEELKTFLELLEKTGLKLEKPKKEKEPDDDPKKEPKDGDADETLKKFQAEMIEKFSVMLDDRIKTIIPTKTDPEPPAPPKKEPKLTAAEKFAKAIKIQK